MAPVSTCEFFRPTLIVYPSGAARATRPRLIVPAAPLTFSIITGCPSETCILAAIIRASVSVGPPAANGNTIVMGRDGYVSQGAGPAASDEHHNRQKNPRSLFGLQLQVASSIS